MTSVQLGAYTPPTDKNEYLDITMGIFFDGTKNNKTNSDEKTADSEVYRENGKDDDESSYYNDWSNVARLWDCYDKNKSIYVEGIGTEDKESDSTTGYAFGSGITGIRGKVRKGCEEIVTNILNPAIKKDRKSKLRTITIDVFGFSRGAAAARNFVYEIGKSEYKASLVPEPETGMITKLDDDDYSTNLDTLPACGHLGLKLSQLGINIKPNQIRIRFLGIFDTVSSYSKYISAIPDFNDVAELHLNQIGNAQTVIHFTADDEHRENFSLTRVHVGTEKNFPGVHSDVGGSYDTGPEVKNELETSWTSKLDLEVFRKKLIEQCWYEEKELEITGGFLYWALKGTRDKIKKEYSYIPLHFMSEYAKNTKLPVDRTAIEEKYSISKDELLVRVKDYMRDYVMSKGLPYTFKQFAEIDQKYKNAKIPEQQYADYQKEKQAQKDLRILRNKYLHWSARREGIGMDPTSNGKRVIY